MRERAAAARTTAATVCDYMTLDHWFLSHQCTHIYTFFAFFFVPRRQAGSVTLYFGIPSFRTTRLTGEAVALHVSAISGSVLEKIHHDARFGVRVGTKAGSLADWMFHFVLAARLCAQATLPIRAPAI